MGEETKTVVIHAVTPSNATNSRWRSHAMPYDKRFCMRAGAIAVASTHSANAHFLRRVSGSKLDALMHANAVIHKQCDKVWMHTARVLPC